MSDNFPLTPGSGRNAATDEVSYSGDTADVQLVRPVLVSGSEGSKTVVGLPGDATNGLIVDLGANNDVTVTGTVTVAQATAANLNATVVGTGTFAVQAAQSGGWSVAQLGTWNVSTVTTVSTVTSLAQFAGNAIDTNSGNSDAGTLRVVIATDQPALSNALTVNSTLQAGTALAGRVSASDETSTIYNATTALTPKFAAISASSSGNNTVISAVASKKIRVLRMHLSSNGAVNAKFTDGAGGSDLTGLQYLTQYGGFGAAYCPVGLFETTANTALVLNLSGAVAVGGVLTYVEV